MNTAIRGVKSRYSSCSKGSSPKQIHMVVTLGSNQIYKEAGDVNKSKDLGASPQRSVVKEGRYRHLSRGIAATNNSCWVVRVTLVNLGVIY